MFGKITKGISRASGGKKGFKYKINIQVEKLDNLPAPVKKCRVVWSRGPKVQMTEAKDVVKGAVIFHQQLSQIATMYKDAKDDFEPKEYKFQVQVPSKEGDGKLMTVGKADLDLSHFVLNEGQPQNKLIPIMFKVGAASTGYLKVSIVAEPVSGDVDDDGMPEVSALTGMTAHLDDDQDLSGFEDDEDHPKSGPKPTPSALSSTNKRPASRLNAIPTPTPSPTPPAAAEPKPESKKPSKTDDKPASSSRKSSAAADNDDGDISPMSMSPEDSPRELSRKGSREAGRQSTVPSLSAAAVSKATAGRKADKDARSALFGTAPASSSQPAGRAAAAAAKTPSSKSIKELSEDEARSELFAAGASRARAAAGGSSSAAKPNSSSARPRSVPDGTAQPAAATTSSSASSSRPIAIPRSPSSRSDISTSSAGGTQSSTAAGGGGAARRGLLDRSRTNKDSDAAVPAADAPSSKQQPLAAGPRAAGVSAAGSASQHSLSDDEDEPAAAKGNGLLKPITSRVSAATASRIPNMSGSGAQQQDQPSARGAAGGARGRLAGSDGDTAAMKQLAAENEKMKAQMAALRDQAAQAEDARRQARLAAENAAAERDDYKAQVQELEQQLKEVVSSSVSAEEDQDLVQQVTALQKQLQQQQQGQQQQQLGPLSTRDTADLQMQCERLQQELLQSKSSTEQLQQQLRELQSRSAELQQRLESAHKEADEQYEQLQEQVRMQQDSMEQMKQLQQQLDDAMQLLEQQDAAAAAAPANAKPAADVPALSAMVVELRDKLAKQEHATKAAQQQRDGMLALVLTEVHMTSQQEHVKHFVWDNQLVDAAQRAVAEAKLALDGQMQDELQQVLVCFKAATAAAVEQASQIQDLQKQTKDLLSALDAAQSELQAAKSMQHQAASRQPQLRASREQEQPGMALLKQQVTQLEAEAAQLRAEKQQLVQQRLQGRSLLDGPGPRPASEYSNELDEPQLVQADIVLLDDAHIPGKDSQELSKQLSSSQRKVQQLIKTRDKLEIILKDFETSSAEEKEQFLVQLSAANQQLRRLTQQSEQTQRELAVANESKQKLEQDLQNAEVALAAAELAAAEAREEHDLLQHALAEAQAAATTAAVDGPTDASWSIPAQVIALADNAAADSGLQEALSSAQEQAADLQKQLAEADSSKRALEKELGRLRKQLSDEQAERATLDEQLAQHLEDTGDYTAQDTVAAFEAKYNRLKTRYRELTESHRDEVTALHEEIAALQERVVDLEAAAAQLDAARSQAQHGEATLADALAKGSKTGAELAALRTENQQLMQSLVAAKLELAQVSEREVIGKRELYKAKETNMKLASKMTKLETLVYK